MAEKDITEKTLEELDDVFADIANVLLFNGEQVIRPEDLQDSLPRTNYTASGKIREQERDVAKYWSNSEIRIALVGVENQTNPDDDMPIRVIGYDGAAYRDQIKRDETAETKVRFPVVTLVLYFGFERHWDQAKTLYECIPVDDRLKPFVNDYHINLFEIAYLSDEQVQMFRSDFKYVADYYVQARKGGDYIPPEGTIEHVDELLNLMSAIDPDTRYEESYREYLKFRKNEEGITMSSVILDRIEERAERRGEARTFDAMSALYKKLDELDRLDDWRHALDDGDLLKDLLREFSLISEPKDSEDA